MQLHIQSQIQLGLRRRDIVKNLVKIGVNESVVYRTIKRINETGAVDGREHNGRKVSVTVPAMVKRVRSRIDRNPRRSQRRMAKELIISRGSLRNIVKNKIGKRALKRATSQMLSAQNKKDRFIRSKALLKRLGEFGHRTIVFFDEKQFGQEQPYVPQNDRVIATSIQSLPKKFQQVPRASFPAKLHIGVAASYECKFPLVFFEKCEKVNGELLRRRVLEPILEELPLEVRRKKNWIFDWDGAGCHKGKLVQRWMREHLPDFIDAASWPPSSPDCMLQDYFLNNRLERGVKLHERRSNETFRRALVREWDRIPMEEVREAIDTLPKRLRLCVKQRGDYFEHLL